MLAVGGLLYYSQNCSLPDIMPHSSAEVKYEQTDSSLDHMIKDWNQLNGDERIDFIKNEVGYEIGQAYQNLQKSIDDLTSTVCDEYQR